MMSFAQLLKAIELGVIEMNVSLVISSCYQLLLLIISNKLDIV